VYQNNLNDFRKWHEDIQNCRDEEAETLQDELAMAEAKIRLAKKLLSQVKRSYLEEHYEDKIFKDEEIESYVIYDSPRSDYTEAERRYQLAWEWKWKIERCLHDLIRGERDDLEYLAKLSGRERRKHIVGTDTQTTNGSQMPERIGNKRNRQHKKISHTAKTDV
jgi:hypothetical protein